MSRHARYPYNECSGCYKSSRCPRRCETLDESSTIYTVGGISSASKTAVATQSNIQLEVEEVPGN